MTWRGDGRDAWRGRQYNIWMACACQATALDSCGVQASQEREAADIPHGCLSIQSLLSFAPPKLHEKLQRKPSRMTRLRTGMRPCPSRSTDFAEFLDPVLPSYQPLSLVVDGARAGEYFLTNALSESQHRIRMFSTPWSIVNASEDHTRGWSKCRPRA